MEVLSKDLNNTWSDLVCPTEVILFEVWECPILKGYANARKRPTTEEIVTKLRQVDVLTVFRLPMLALLFSACFGQAHSG